MALVLTADQKETSLTPEEFCAFPVVASCASDEPLAVAVSGGPDSMALCYLLSQWAEKNNGPQIHAITVNHGLRAEAAEEARQVGRWLSDFPFVTHHILTNTYGGDNRPSSRIMEGAREARYGLLRDFCRAHKISKLYVAHHMDDQAETLLFRLAKGSGLDGLCAMREVQVYDESMMLLRPLLGVSKDRLIATCEAHDVPYVLDPSNTNSSFARVRLRQSAAILEEEGLSAKRLAVTASRIERGRTALDVFAERVYADAVLEGDKHSVLFSFEKLMAEPEEIRLRVLKKAMSNLKRPDNEIRSYGPRTERFEALVGRIFNESAFVSATLGGFLFIFDKKQGTLCVKPE